MSWGTKTVLAIVIFVSGIMAMVFVSMNQKIDLVTDNYYEKDLKYQNEIDKINNTNELKELPDIIKSTESLIINFPKSSLPDSGKIILYKPSDDKQDKTFNIEKNNGDSISIDLSKFSTGFWRVKLFWASGGVEFKLEDSFYK